MAIEYARGSPRNMALGWASLIITAYTGYYFAKKLNTSRKLEYIRKQANSDSPDIPEHVLTRTTGPTPIESMWDAMKRYWDK
ncbi:hypothetical protein MCUN1_001346 [Malassezia cuniculi]|uniref:Uncharacterized protein n=1 Tax=Malassezia cuniculi TaxID=948313 RepID=A0AAF0ESN0_9BASI|nr:hypothetical protein MCUN1_001346 [Malassezia cuniculi]